ncbi:GyrI-like domain-containing protein [Listeria ivanovii]|uniref:Effector binding domain-containing protein n=2 Tax=Listeria ivanovii TaxID=1638 RepID=A0ABS1G7B9_LISIV|nr:effector binding domain-containing protein [Listeria ivanovii]EFR95923.1 transcriptional activator [Listeria ivanovii FSL F6-596]AIS60756.1 transcription activator effector-binding protein [Listeria ivanovii subsp. londoniensis]AIS63583.1 transcription activator effector-binding protein [Listeria ivanovii subsp. londoniensis]MBK1962790.1 effector binding domain-containing protein [Listeria ivanovii subsp. londoniensis]MBK1967527.1 effector binding domain-containing protein [Listeria ivanovi
MNLQENKVIYGKQIRTNNDDFSPIARLWGEVMVEKPTGDIFAVYSNYASDYMGDYDLLVGTTNWKQEMTANIEAGEYLVFKVDTTNPKGVEQAWNEIWKRNSELNRAYNTDFEWYHTDGKIEVYISI